ncbi:hypothetical protein [Pseudomonas entomophila]|nr:hypothetical protein [Pseudomonas entomophila]WMW07220.1 hypothetical protein RAH46_07745 [Pseudomonas entomophila]
MKDLTVSSQLESSDSTRVDALMNALAGMMTIGDDSLRIAVKRVDDHVNYLEQLPASLESMTWWLGYSDTDEPELMPQRMLELVDGLRWIAREWWPLRYGALFMGRDLVDLTHEVERLGEQTLGLASRLEALGGGQYTWEQLAQDDDLPLSPGDRQQVVLMAERLDTLRLLVNGLAGDVTLLLADFGAFRDKYRYDLTPQVNGKRVALERAQVHDLSRYPDFWRRLMEPRLLEAYDADLLNSRLERMDPGIIGVTRHLEQFHSTWQEVDAYAEGAANSLKAIDTRQRLAIFMVYFKRFLSEWLHVGALGERLKIAFA